MSSNQISEKQRFLDFSPSRLNFFNKLTEIEDFPNSDKVKPTYSEIDTANEVSIIDTRESLKSNEIHEILVKPLKPERELYPGMRKTPSHSILKKSQNKEKKIQIEEIFISDVSLKDDEKNGRLNKEVKITFNEDVKVSIVPSFKKYNETGDFSTDCEGNCNCMIF